MIRLGVMGTGTVFSRQIAALGRWSDRYEIVAVCDSHPLRLGEARGVLTRAGFSEGVALCASADELLDCDTDAVLISTPPQTHDALAMACLARGADVLLEKPAVLSVDKLDGLYAQASRSGALLHVAYHAAFAVDLRWYLEYRRELSERYGLGRISKIYCGFYDPYCIDGVLLPDKDKLMGSYLDSGVNQLSVCHRILGLNGASTISHYSQTDCNGVVIASHTHLSNGETELFLDTDWTLGLNRKRTVIQYRDTPWQVVLDHSNQRVILQPASSHDGVLGTLRGAEEIEVGREGVLLFEDTARDRLQRHYEGVFSDFERAVSDRIANEAATRTIHRLLLEN